MNKSYPVVTVRSVKYEKYEPNSAKIDSAQIENKDKP